MSMENNLILQLHKISRCMFAKTTYHTCSAVNYVKKSESLLKMIISEFVTSVWPTVSTLT